MGYQSSCMSLSMVQRPASFGSSTCLICCQALSPDSFAAPRRPPITGGGALLVHSWIFLTTSGLLGSGIIMIWKILDRISMRGDLPATARISARFGLWPAASRDWSLASSPPWKESPWPSVGASRVSGYHLIMVIALWAGPRCQATPVRDQFHGSSGVDARLVATAPRIGVVDQRRTWTLSRTPTWPPPPHSIR